VKLENFFELSFCINLKERTDRWEECQEEFEKIHFYPERFEAIKDKNPVIGCLKSHIEILKIAKQENKNVLIFEDDVSFINTETHIVEKALDELYNLDFCLFYLGGNILKPFYQITNHLAKLTHCQSTHAYSCSKKYVPMVLDFLEKNIYYVDCLYSDYIVPSTPCFVTVPLIATQRTSYSDIEHREMTYDVPIQRYWDNLVRLPKNKL
jgi:GR25 family glycosyltransferase involved in LPS biosynthesis